MTDQPRNSAQVAALGRRRLILGGAGGLTLSVAALSLPGCASVSVGGRLSEKPGDDPALLNNALGLEYEAISAYDSVLALAVLSDSERDLAAAFRADHLKHADAIAAAVKRLGGTPVAAPAKGYPFAATALPGRDDALRFLVGIEEGLALAHLSAVPALAAREYAKGAAGILGVESMHWAVWRRALGEDPVPMPIIG